MKVAETFCGGHRTLSSAPCQSLQPPDHAWPCHTQKKPTAPGHRHTLMTNANKLQESHQQERECSPSTCPTCPSCCARTCHLRVMMLVHTNIRFLHLACLVRVNMGSYHPNSWSQSGSRCCILSSAVRVTDST